VITKAEKTRQFIIEKAALILNEKGMAGTAISDIMQATKLAKGGIYGNFESKDEICLEAFNYLYKGLSSGIEIALQSATTAKGKLFAMLHHYRHTLTLTNKGGCPILNFGAEADDTNPVIKQKVAGAIRSSQARISELVSAGIKTGEFNTSVDAETFGVKMFTMLEGAILASRVLNSSRQMEIVTDLLQAEIEAFSTN
jgi:TetR/AcrR family transcriptional repressor of nem operon